MKSRLFWKFFIFIWLVQMAGMVAVGTTFWLRHRAVEQQQVENAQRAERNIPPRPFHQRRGAPRPFPLVPLVATLLASLLCAGLLARYFSRPIRSMRDAFRQASSGDLSVRLEPAMGRRRDELADLGHEFDRMAGQLSTLMDAQRRLLHDVSHELRSPLARLQAAIGLARQQPDKQAGMLERIEQESGRIDHLVGELLALSRLECGSLDGMQEQFEIDELLHDIVGNARFEAEVATQRVEFTGAGEVLVRGQPELLYQAIENVVRNALKHAPPGSEIRIEARLANDQEVLMVIEDQGPGVPEAELAQIFEPFYRASNAGQPGYGLGLAIARRALLAHGGDIRASNRPGGGLRMEIRLPASRG